MGDPFAEGGLGPYRLVRRQPGPQLIPLVFAALSHGGMVVEGAHDAGDDVSKRAAAGVGNRLLQPHERDGRPDVRQAVQPEQIGEGAALLVVQRADTHTADGTTGGQALVHDLPKRPEGATVQARKVAHTGRSSVSSGAPGRSGPSASTASSASTPMPFHTKRTLVTASSPSSAPVINWWTAMPESSR